MRYVRRTGDRPDGCLTFWRRGAFREVTAEAVRLRDLGLRDNVALLVLLEPVPQGAAGGRASGALAEGPTYPTAPNGKAADFALGTLPVVSSRGDSTAQGCAVSAGKSACGSAANGDMQDAAMAQPAYGPGSGKAASRQLAEGVEGGSAPQAPLLLVGNTHLLFNPRRGDIKVMAIGACRYFLALLALTRGRLFLQSGTRSWGVVMLLCKGGIIRGSAWCSCSVLRLAPGFQMHHVRVHCWQCRLNTGVPAAQVAQARMILNRMAALRVRAGRPALALLAGDFNSAPGSGVVRFIAAGELDCAGEDRRALSGQLECQERGWRAGRSVRFLPLLCTAGVGVVAHRVGR